MSGWKITGVNNTDDRGDLLGTSYGPGSGAGPLRAPVLRELATDACYYPE